MKKILYLCFFIPIFVSAQSQRTSLSLSQKKQFIEQLQDLALPEAIPTPEQKEFNAKIIIQTLQIQGVRLIYKDKNGALLKEFNAQNGAEFPRFQLPKEEITAEIWYNNDLFYVKNGVTNN